MNSAYTGLLFGLLGAIVLVYFVIVINFQSWSDSFVIITALPAALAGIIWMLFATHTTLSVPALTGAIMRMGVATANSVLVISFARQKLTEIGDATQAALEAGFVRLRPVLLTALAMVIGMLPMALEARAGLFPALGLNATGPATGAQSGYLAAASQRRSHPRRRRWLGGFRGAAHRDGIYD